MGRSGGFAGDVERGESAALLGRDASTSGGYDDDGDDDAGAVWMTHATGGVVGASTSTSNRKTRERARATRRGLAVAAAACGVACAAAVGVWTHKSETLQEKWRPVPGAEMMTSTAAARGRNAGIARWAARGSDGSVARLGEADTSALTGVTPTASQMMALRALRLQIRNAMFDPNTSSQTVATLSKQLLNVVPEASAALPTGKASTVDELDGVVKALMANGASAEVSTPAVEGEFREPAAPDGRRTSVPVDDPNPLAHVTQDPPPPRKPLTSYESALFETRAAARQTAAIGKERKHSGGQSSELQTVRAEDKLEQMINSLDASGEPRTDVDFTRESPRALARDYDMMQQQEARYNDPQAVDEYQPQPSYSDAYAYAPQQSQQQMQPEEAPVRFEGRDAFAPQPNFDAQAFEPTVQEEPARPSAFEFPDEHAAPWESEEESTPLEAAQPAVVEEKKPEEHEDVSWAEFSGESDSVDKDDDDDIEPTPSPSPMPMPTPEPSPEPDPMPEPTEPDDPLDIDSLFANTGDAQSSVVNNDDDEDENKHASSSSRSRGHHRSDASSSSPSRMVKPLVPKADAKAIAGKVVDMIMSQMGTSDDSANVGSTLDGVSHPPFNPQLSKDEIAAQLVSALTAMSTEVVEQNAELNAAATDAAAPTTANTKIIADALVEHDEKMAQRIARVLARDSLFDDEDNTAAMGLSRRAKRVDDDVSKLILYEESRRQRDELQAMRRDLAALMANIQANYAMGVTQDRIDKTAAAAAGHIVDKLRPVFSRGDDGKDAVASTGESELSDSTLFDYPVMPSSKLSKETLRLDGFGAGISLDGSNGEEDSLDARLTGGDNEEDNYEADGDDNNDDDDSVSALDSLDLLSQASKKSSSSDEATLADQMSKGATLADQMSKGATLSRKDKDDSKTSADGNEDDLPAWAGANALSDAELTAGFVSDETDVDGESIVSASSNKSSKSRKKKKSSSLGLDESGDDDVTKSDATAKQNDYIASLTRRARDALKNRRHL